MDMERKKKKILAEKELSIRLKSRAMWLLHGDGNTKFFHNFYKNRTTVNTIWELTNEEGQSVTGFDDLTEVCSSHFYNLYKADSEITPRKMMDLV